MDIPLWVGLLMAFGDMAVATYIGMRYGPERAKRLTIQEFQQPATAKQVQEALNMPTRTDMALLKADLDKAVAEQRTYLTDFVKQLPKPEFSATMQLPVQMQDAVQRDLRAVARSVFKEVVSSDLEELLDKAVQKAMQGGGAPESIEQANKLADEAELVAYLDQLAQAYNLPPAAVAVAKRLGKAAVPWLNARYSLGLEEVLP